MIQDPPRLLDSSNDTLIRELLRAGRDVASPDSEQRRAVRQRLIADRGAGAAGEPRSLAMALRPKRSWLLVGGLAAALTAGAAAARQLAGDPARRTESDAHAAAPRLAETSTQALQIGSAVPVQPRPDAEPATAQGARAAPARPVSKLDPATTKRVLPSPRALGGAFDSVVADAQPVPVPQSRGVEHTEASAVFPATAPTAAPTAAQRALRNDSHLAEELELLQRARGWLGSNPSRALESVRDYEVRFAHGELWEEKEVVAIEALLRLGMRAEADARARAFLSHASSSAHAAKIRRLLNL